MSISPTESQRNDVLSEREWEIFDLLVLTPLTNDEIAARFGVQKRTIKWYVNRITAAFGVRTRLELVVTFWRTFVEEQGITLGPVAKKRPTPAHASRQRIRERATPIAKPGGWAPARASIKIDQRAAKELGWTAEQHASRLLLKAPAVESRLRIFVFKKPSGRVVDEDLFSHMSAWPDVESSLIPAHYGPFTGWSYERTKARPRYDFRTIWLRHDDLMVVVDYLGPSKVLEKQREGIEVLLRSLRLADAPPPRARVRKTPTKSRR